MLDTKNATVQQFLQSKRAKVAKIIIDQQKMTRNFASKQLQVTTKDKYLRLGENDPPIALIVVAADNFHVELV